MLAPFILVKGDEIHILCDYTSLLISYQIIKYFMVIPKAIKQHGVINFVQCRSNLSL